MPPITADSHAVALMGCPPLIVAVDGTGCWDADQVRQRFGGTPLEWFVASVALQHQGHLRYTLYAALEASVPWQEIALEEIAQGSIDSAGVLWLAQRFPLLSEERPSG